MVLAVERRTRSWQATHGIPEEGESMAEKRFRVRDSWPVWAGGSTVVVVGLANQWLGGGASTPPQSAPTSVVRPPHVSSPSTAALGGHAGSPPASPTKTRSPDGRDISFPIVNDGRDGRTDVPKGARVGYGKAEVHFAPSGQVRVRLCVAQTAGDPSRRLSVTAQGIMLPANGPKTVLGAQQLVTEGSEEDKESCVDTQLGA